MNHPVKLTDLCAALDYPDDWGVWLDRETGAVIPLDPETMAADDDDDANVDADAEHGEDSLFPDFVPPEDRAIARAIANDDPRYLALPDRFDFHEYRHMERWVAGIAEPRVAEQLWRAIKGKGAFRHFKDTAHRLGLIDDWFAYRQQAIERHMLQWAEAHGVPVDRTPSGETR